MLPNENLLSNIIIIMITIITIYKSRIHLSTKSFAEVLTASSTVVIMANVTNVTIM